MDLNLNLCSIACFGTRDCFGTGDFGYSITHLHLSGNSLEGAANYLKRTSRDLIGPGS